MTASALSGERFCQYKLRDEEYEERRVWGSAGSTSRRIFPALQKCIYTQIEVFRENSNLFPEVARSKCRDLFFSKYYAFAMVFIDVLSSRMHGVRTRASHGGGNIGTNIDSSTAVGVRLPFFC